MYDTEANSENESHFTLKVTGSGAATIGYDIFCSDSKMRLKERNINKRKKLFERMAEE